MKHFFFTVLLVTLPFVSARAETKPQVKPNVESLGDNKYKIGLINFDSKKGEISFPATLEHNEVLIEYLITTSQGKIHEALLVTDILPFNLNVAMKLLGYKESKELLVMLDDDYRPTGKPFIPTKEQKKMSRFSISVDWKIDGKSFSHDVTSLLENAKEATPMPASPWIYSGSYIHNGKFKPDLSGDIIAVFTDRSAMACYSGEGREDDTLWTPIRKLLPPLGTEVTITFKQLQSSK